jgi:hypothetical protein
VRYSQQSVCDARHGRHDDDWRSIKAASDDLYNLIYRGCVLNRRAAKFHHDHMQFPESIRGFSPAPERNGGNDILKLTPPMQSAGSTFTPANPRVPLRPRVK